MRHRSARLAVHLLGSLVAVASILVAVAAWRLAQGPITLDRLAHRLEAVLNDQALGYRFDIGAARLAWGGWQRVIEFHALDVELWHRDGRRALAADEVRLSLALAPLLRGRLRPRSLDLVRPRLLARRDLDGTIAIALLARPEAGADRGPIAGEAPLSGAELVEAFLAARDAAPFDRLDRVGLSDAWLKVEDRVLGSTWTARGAHIVLRRRDQGLLLLARAVLESGRASLDLDLAAAYAPADDTIVLSSGLADFELAHLPLLIEGAPSLDGLDMRVDGELTLALTTDFVVREGSFAIESEGGRVDLSGVFEAPFELGPSRAAGRIRPGRGGVDLSDLVLDLGLERFELRGALGGWGRDAPVAIELALDGLPVDQLGRYWPPDIAPPAREWLTARLSGGEIRQARIAFDAGLGALTEGRLPLRDVSIELDLLGASIHYMDGMPPAEGVSGHMRIVDDGFRFDAHGGEVAGLDLRRAALVIDDLTNGRGMAIDLQAAGEVPDLLRLAAAAGPAAAARVALDPADVEGAFDGRAEIVLGRLEGLTAEDVTLRFGADLDQLVLTAAPQAFRVDGGEGRLSLDTDGIAIDGGVRVNGVPFEADYRQSFRSGEAWPRRLRLRGRPSGPELRRLGMPADLEIEGLLDLDVTVAWSADGRAIWTLALDLEAASARHALLPIDKAAGVPGRAFLRVVDDGGGTLVIDDFEAAAGDREVRGSGLLRASDLALMRLDLARAVLGRNRLAGSVTWGGEVPLDVVLSGGEFDLEPMLADIATASGPGLPALRIQGRLDRVWLSEGQALSGVDVAGVHDGEVWDSLSVAGRVAESASLSLAIRRRGPGQRDVAFDTSDAGLALGALGLSDDVAGGRLEIRARIDDGDPRRPWSGKLELRDFTMRRAPLLARLLALTPTPGAARALASAGLPFTLAELPFEKVGDIVTVSDARAFGPGLGLTIFGRVDLGRDEIALAGTLLPVYPINMALGALPLIGDIVRGFDKGGGLVGFDYSLTGPSDDPEVGVDLLSVMTPGILRQVFRSPGGNGSR